MSCFSAALSASESHTWKIASPGGVERRTAFSFELPRSGVRGKAYQNHRQTSSTFLHFFAHYFSRYALTHPFSYGLRAIIIFRISFLERPQAEVSAERWLEHPVLRPQMEPCLLPPLPGLGYYMHATGGCARWRELTPGYCSAAPDGADITEVIHPTFRE